MGARGGPGSLEAGLVLGFQRVLHQRRSISLVFLLIQG